MDEPTATGVDTTVMAIREAVMDYFKGTCVTRTTRSNVRLNDDPHDYSETQNRRQQNWYRSFRQPMLLYLQHDTPFLGMRKEPDTVTLFPNVFNRSVELTAVKDQLTKFMGDFLPSIELTERDCPYHDEEDEYDDNALVRQATVRGNEPEHGIEAMERLLEAHQRMTRTVNLTSTLSQADMQRMTYTVRRSSNSGNVFWNEINF